VRHAPRVATDRAQRLCSEEVDTVGYGGPDATPIVVVAKATELEGLSVEEEARSRAEGGVFQPKGGVERIDLCTGAVSYGEGEQVEMRPSNAPQLHRRGKCDINGEGGYTTARNLPLG